MENTQEIPISSFPFGFLKMHKQCMTTLTYLRVAETEYYCNQQPLQSMKQLKINL